MAALHKTRGIVLNYIRYRETSIIVKVYTEQFGLQTYIENGVRSAKGKNRIALFQPLTLLDLVVYHDDKKEIHRISEMRCNRPFKTLPFDILKSSIGLFLTEILSKTLKEETGNSVLFDFLFHALIELDDADKHFENFHLIFLLQLTFYLGFSPENAQEIVSQFKEYSIGIGFSDAQQTLIDDLLHHQSQPVLSRKDRNHLLEVLLLYYKLHIEEIGEIKSLQVLQEVMQ